MAGACAGPILGAVLTLALGQGSAPRAAVLLAAYGAGMVIPLLLLTVLWDRLGPRSRAVLRGRGVTVAGRTLHTTTLLTGLLIIALAMFQVRVPCQCRCPVPRVVSFWIWAWYL